MNNNITYRDVDTAKVKEILKSKSFDKEEPALDYMCAEDVQSIKRKVSDLTISELYELIPKIIRECKKQDAEDAKVAYQEKWPDKITKE